MKRYSDEQLVLFLIQEELKNRKLFTGLSYAGLEDCYYQSYFGDVILSYMGFEDESDELTEWYFELVDKYTAIVKTDREILNNCTSDFYYELRAEKQRREPK